MDPFVRMINEVRHISGLNNKDFANKAGVTEGRWHDLKARRREPRLPEMVKLADAVGMAFDLVGQHHQPFLRLTLDESIGIFRLADHFRRNGPQNPVVLRQAVNKLEIETRGKNWL